MREKEQIEKAIGYLKAVSIFEPKEIWVEEIEAFRVVLSFKNGGQDYIWQERIFKEFRFRLEPMQGLEVESMRIYEKVNQNN